jgi:hypothetical protein
MAGSCVTFVWLRCLQEGKKVDALETLSKVSLLVFSDCVLGVRATAGAVLVLFKAALPVSVGGWGSGHSEFQLCHASECPSLGEGW